MRTGRVESVWLERRGTQLTAAAPEGAQVLSVAFTGDFDEDGGQLYHVPTGVVYDYSSFDANAETITLASPLPVGESFDDGDALRVYPLADDAYAHVRLEDVASDEEPITARISHSMRGMLVEGQREPGDGEVALVELTRSEWVVRDITGHDGAVFFGEVRTDVDGKKRIVINKNGVLSPVEMRLYPYDNNDDTWAILAADTDPTSGTIAAYLYPSTTRADGGYAGLSATENLAQILHAIPGETPHVRTAIGAHENRSTIETGYHHVRIDGRIPNIDGTAIRRILIEHLDSSGNSISNANLWFRREHGAVNSPWIAAPNRQSGILFGGSRIYIVAGDQSLPSVSHGPLTCSSLTQSSSSSDKKNIRPLPFDALNVVRNATASEWQYNHEDDDTPFVHIGPMAEDLPAQVLQEDESGKRLVDLGSLVGVLWQAVQDLTRQVDELKGATS